MDFDRYMGNNIRHPKHRNIKSALKKAFPSTPPFLILRRTKSDHFSIDTDDSRVPQKTSWSPHREQSKHHNTANG